MNKKSVRGVLDSISNEGHILRITEDDSDPMINRGIRRISQDIGLNGVVPAIGYKDTGRTVPEFIPPDG